MLGAIERAVGYFNGDKAMWRRMQKRGMAIDFSWKQAAGEYLKLYDLLLEPDAAHNAAAPQEAAEPAKAPPAPSKTIDAATVDCAAQAKAKAEKPARRQAPTKKNDA